MFLKAAPEYSDVLSKADCLFEPGNDFWDGTETSSSCSRLTGDSTYVGNVTPIFCCEADGFCAGRVGPVAMPYEIFVGIV